MFHEVVVRGSEWQLREPAGKVS